MNRVDINFDIKELSFEEAIEGGEISTEMDTAPLYVIKETEAIRGYAARIARLYKTRMHIMYRNDQSPAVKFWMQSKIHGQAWYVIMDSWFSRRLYTVQALWSELHTSTANAQKILKDAEDLELIVKLTPKDLDDKYIESNENRAKLVCPTKNSLAAFMAYSYAHAQLSMQARQEIHEEGFHPAYHEKIRISEIIDQIKTNLSNPTIKEWVSRYFKLFNISPKV